MLWDSFEISDRMQSKSTSGFGPEHKQAQMVGMGSHAVGGLGNFHGCEALPEQLPEQVARHLGAFVEGQVYDALGVAESVQAV